MPIGNFYQQTGISIFAYEPTINVSTPSYTPEGLLFDTDLSNRVSSYTHTISAFGGYDRASFSINYDELGASEWIDKLGYHVVVYNPYITKIWEGFVNKITISVGGLTATRGPLTDIANSVFVVYSTFDGSTVPPTLGMRETTAVTTNSVSQNRYGVIQKAISIGGASEENAEQVRDVWLAENALPDTGQSFNSQASVNTRVIVECLGYYHWLGLFVWNSTVSGDREISDAIKDVFNYENTYINGMYSTDLSNIETPASTVDIKRYVNENQTALARIKYLVAFGDGADNRQLFGIYNDLTPYYYSIPTEIEYTQSIGRNVQTVRDAAGNVLDPWDIVPGKWLEFTDFLTTSKLSADFDENPRIEFMESVTYTAPYSVTHTGNKVGTFKQRLAKFGLTGVG